MQDKYKFVITECSLIIALFIHQIVDHSGRAI
jgi:hypothetical protein